MTIKEWKPGMAVSIIGAINFESTIERGTTTETPPFTSGNITRVEVVVESGRIRNVAIGRLTVGHRL